VLTGERSERQRVTLEKTRGSKLAGALAGWDAEGAQATWRVCVPEAGPRTVKVCYACTTDLAGGEFVVSASPGLETRGRVEATHENWSEFRPFKAGELNFPKAGEYTISVRPAGSRSKELFKLLWVCLEPSRPERK
jgi:hypothetical protein